MHRSEKFRLQKHISLLTEGVWPAAAKADLLALQLVLVMKLRKGEGI